MSCTDLLAGCWVTGRCQLEVILEVDAGCCFLHILWNPYIDDACECIEHIFIRLVNDLRLGWKKKLLDSRIRNWKNLDKFPWTGGNLMGMNVKFYLRTKTKLFCLLLLFGSPTAEFLGCRCNKPIQAGWIRPELINRVMQSRVLLGGPQEGGDRTGGHTWQIYWLLFK